MKILTWLLQICGRGSQSSSPVIANARLDAGQGHISVVLPVKISRRVRVRRCGSPSAAWMRNYEHLLAYRRLHPQDWPKQGECFADGNRLGLWCFHQRRARRTGRMLPDRIRMLDAIRFPWDGRHYWYRQYRLLGAFREKHPDRWPACREEWPAGNTLGVWCHTQRTAHKRQKLSPGKVDLLNLIGFEWVSTYHEDVAGLQPRRSRSPVTYSRAPSRGDVTVVV